MICFICHCGYTCEQVNEVVVTRAEFYWLISLIV